MMIRRWRKEFQPKQKQMGIKFFVISLALLSLCFFYGAYRVGSRVPAPEIRALIDVNAKRMKISPLLLEAVILTESKFDEEAVSHVGALGIMQLMPDTAEWISSKSALPADRLERPEENIPLGTWYLRFLLDEYEQNEVLALAAYNAGRGNVDEWKRNNHWGNDMITVEEIPFSETREFVKNVMVERDRLKDEGREDNYGKD